MSATNPRSGAGSEALGETGFSPEGRCGSAGAGRTRSSVASAPGPLDDPEAEHSHRARIVAEGSDAQHARGAPRVGVPTLVVAAGPRYPQP